MEPRGATRFAASTVAPTVASSSRLDDDDADAGSLVSEAVSEAVNQQAPEDTR